MIIFSKLKIKFFFTERRKDVNRYEKEMMKQFEQMSPTLKKVALFLREEPGQFASKSASKIATTIGVSETSVIRFVYAIHYNSFSELQQDVQNSIYELKNSFKELSTEIPTNGKTGIEEVMIRDQINIKKTAENIDPVVFKEVVDKISTAREVFVLGSGASYGFAHWFGFMLNTIRGNSRVFNMFTDDISYISTLDQDCVLVTFSFNRYIKQTLELSNELKEQGVYIVGITDSEIAPIHQIADSTFVTKMSHMSTFDSGPVIAALLNTILNQIIIDNPTTFKKKRKRYEQTLKNLFWSEKLHYDNNNHKK